MHAYGVPTEIVRLVLAIGILVSLLVYERWQISSGAVVVAGYLALFVDRPLYILTTLTVSVVTYYLVSHVISNKIYLYGRRRLVVMVMTGMLLQFFTGLGAYLFTPQTPWMVGLYGVGFVLPGLIAADMERQSVQLTLLTVAGTTLFTFLLFRGVLMLENFLPVIWDDVSFGTGTIQYSFDTRLLIPAVILSVVVGALLFEWKGVRSGGFLTAGYAALFVLTPLHLLFISAVGVLVYFFVTRLLMRHTPIFGRLKFATMVLTALMVFWGLEAFTEQVTQTAFVPFAGFGVISPMIAALVANDGERQGVPKTLVGLAVCTLIVFTIIKSIDLFLI